MTNVEHNSNDQNDGVVPQGGTMLTNIISENHDTLTRVGPKIILRNQQGYVLY